MNATQSRPLTFVLRLALAAALLLVGGEGQRQMPSAKGQILSSFGTWHSTLGTSLAAAATTAPDVPKSTDPQFAPLLKMCQKMGQRQWGQAIVETFSVEDLKAPDKDAWKTQSGKIERKDGKLLVKADPNNMALVSRVLPTSLKDSEGLRVEAWVQIKPMVLNRGMNGAFRNFQNALFIATDATPAYQWDYQYYFAIGNNGNNHSFNSNPYGYGRGGMAAEVKAGKLLHVTMELIGQQYRCLREGDQPLADTMPNAPGFKVSDKMAIGFMCQSSEFSIVQMAYRGLTIPKDALSADDWKQTAFADQQTLTKFLLDRVVPRLNDAHFPARNAASELLAALWPLSKPAVDAAAAKGSFSAEGQLRLKALGELVPAIKVSSGPPEAAIKAPVTKDLPVDEDDKPKAATTQPAVPRRIRRLPLTQPADPLPRPVLQMK